MKTACFLSVTTWTACLLAFGLSFNTYPAEVAPVDFEKQIKPLLADRCISCHNSDNMMGGLSLQNHAAATVPRKKGATLVPKKPASSLLYITLIVDRTDKKLMPAVGHRLTRIEVELIRRWILEGAAWPEGKAGAIAPPQTKRGDV